MYAAADEHSGSDVGPQEDGQDDGDGDASQGSSESDAAASDTVNVVSGADISDGEGHDVGPAPKRAKISRRSWTPQQKLAMLSKMKRMHWSLHQAAEKLQVARVVLRGWTENAEAIQDLVNKRIKTKKSRGFQKWKTLSEAALAYMLDLRDNKSLAVCKEDIITFCEGYSRRFRHTSEAAKEHFFQRWKNWHGLAYRRISGVLRQAQ